jgi:hypothetical protein
MPVICASIVTNYGLQEKAYLCGMPAPDSHINDYRTYAYFFPGNELDVAQMLFTKVYKPYEMLVTSR